MSLEKIIGDAAERIEAATPRGVGSAVHTEEPSRPATWSVVALIVMAAAVYALVVFVVIRVFDAIIFTKSEAIVLAQFSNQRAIALSLVAILGLIVASVVWAATKLRAYGSAGPVRFGIGEAQPAKPEPEPVTVTVSAPKGSPVNVDAPPPATTSPETAQPEAEMPFEPEPLMSKPTLPLKGFPNEYGD